MRKLLCLFTFLLAALFTFAQQRTIAGTVTGKSGKTPLAGVSVQTKTKTVLTDVSGKFSIEASTGDNITFSYVGMLPVTIKITGDDQSLVIEMEEGILRRMWLLLPAIPLSEKLI